MRVPIVSETVTNVEVTCTRYATTEEDQNERHFAEIEIYNLNKKNYENLANRQKKCGHQCNLITKAEADSFNAIQASDC